MATVEVKIWATDKLYSRDSEVYKKLENGIVNSFEFADGYTASVLQATQNIDAPVEDPFASFTAAPCGTSVDYDNLLQWWDDYLACTSIAEADHSNLLVTDNSGLGGFGERPGNAAVSAGRQLTDLSTDPTVGGCTAAKDALQTALHEVGHNLSLYHDNGNLYEDGDKYYTTNMLNGYEENNDGQDNRCGKYVPEIDKDSQTHCHDAGWFDCEENNFNI